MSSPPAGGFRVYWLGWLVALLVLLTCFLIIMGVYKPDDKTYAYMVGAIALSVFLGTYR